MSNIRHAYGEDVQTTNKLLEPYRKEQSSPNDVSREDIAWAFSVQAVTFFLGFALCWVIRG